jgi:hypothetical protein
MTGFVERTFTYAGVPFPVAVLSPDAIDDRAALDALHDEVHARGIAVCVVRGAPFVWRAAGYDYALDAGAGVVIDTVNLPGLRVTTRPMDTGDIPAAGECFDADARRLIVAEQRDDARWTELLGAPEREYEMVVDPDGDAVGYVAWTASDDGMNAPELVELAGRPEADLRDVALCALRARAGGAPTRLRLGPRHPVYDLLGGRVVETLRPSAWYMRVLDVGALFDVIRPAFDARLAASLLRDASGTLVVHDYGAAIGVRIETGRVVAIEPTALPTADAGAVAAFPPGVLPKVVFGRHLLDDVAAMYPDVVIDAQVRRLVNTLFVAGPSHIDAANTPTT